MDDHLRTSLAGRAPRAIVVEDDESMARLEARVLTADGWSVDHAGSVAEMMDLLGGPRPDLVLMDVMMPDGDGLEILAKLKTDTDTAGIPVVLATGRNDPADIERGLDAGAHDYLTKPFKPHELRARANAALRAGIAAAALSASEALHRQLLGHLPDSAVLVLDRELRLITVGGANTALIDAAPLSLLKDVLSPDDFAALRPRCEEGLAGELSTFELTSHEGRAYNIDVVPLPAPDGTVDRVMTVIKDLGQLRDEEQARRAAEARYRLAFESAPVGMAQLDLDGRFIQVNDALAHLLDHRAQDLTGMALTAISHPTDAQMIRNIVDALVAGQITRHQCESRFLRAAGDVVWLAVSAVTITGDGSGPGHILAHFLDVTDRKDFETQLRRLADHDALTGLLNRRGFEAELTRQAGRARGHAPTGALLILDLDHFKQVNDTLGHSAGDELIISVADLLRRTVRGTDVVARLGGDEFAIILPNASAGEAEYVADKIVHAIRQRVSVLTGDTARSVTASVGVAMFDDPNLTADDILVNADLSMYDAKDTGRDGWASYRSADHDQPRTKARLDWVDRIRAALAEERFELYAEPILDLRTGVVRRYELLLRMCDLGGGVVAPSAFLQVAERVGLVGEIDRRVVTEAIRLLSDPALDVETELEVNLSGLSLGDPELLALITDGLALGGADPRRLIFEVTETAAVANIAVAREFADHVHGLGCRFALDDFGAGFGSFYYLKHLPFDYVKIDGEFVAECMTNLTDRLVIDSVVSIARGLGKETIAEFVSDEPSLRYLAAQGVDHAQGYHIGRPRPVASLLSGTSHPPVRLCKPAGVARIA